MRTDISQLRKLRPFLLIVVAVLLGSLQSVYGQSHGYGFAGAMIGGNKGSVQSAFRYGIGGGWAVAPHVTVGGEVGGVQKDGIDAMVSVNVGVHFRRRVETGFDPFVTGGITGARFGGESGILRNIGGGINYWFRPRVGFRTEFRGYPGGRDLNSFSEFRVGISFR